MVDVSLFLVASVNLFSQPTQSDEDRQFEPYNYNDVALKSDLYNSKIEYKNYDGITFIIETSIDNKQTVSVRNNVIAKGTNLDLLVVAFAYHNLMGLNIYNDKELALRVAKEFVSRFPNVLTIEFVASTLHVKSKDLY